MVHEFDSEAFGCLFMGVVGGQLGLVAIWAVLGPKSWTARLPTTLAVAIFLAVALTLGTSSAEGGGGIPPDVARSLLLVPAVLLATQLPLWVLKLVKGCRIVRHGEEFGREGAPSRQFGIEHLLGATAVVAVCLGLASAGLRPATRWETAVEPWGELLLGCLICSAWSALLTLPCLWAAMGAKEKGVAVFAMMGYVPIVTVFALIVLAAFGGGVDSEAAVMLFLCHAAAVAVMLAMLHVARSSGYALVWTRSAGPPSHASDAPGDTEARAPSPWAEDGQRQSQDGRE
ncbi:MAG: hypothetical protein ACYTG0_08330 [Planctomycetota bacterium]|jgi:hypothetical protein